MVLQKLAIAAKSRSSGKEKAMRARTVITGGLVALALSGCAWPGNAATTPPTTQTDGGNFLPAYLGMLQGKQPLPSNTCPDPKTVKQLLVPCDEGGRP
jgi:hypothetical protein